MKNKEYVILEFKDKKNMMGKSIVYIQKIKVDCNTNTN